MAAICIVALFICPEASIGFTWRIILNYKIDYSTGIGKYGRIDILCNKKMLTSCILCYFIGDDYISLCDIIVMLWPPSIYIEGVYFSFCTANIFIFSC